MSKIKMGIIGLGHWGKNYVRTLDRMSDVDLVACVDKNPAQFAALKENYPQIHFTIETEEILKNQDIDALVITTSSSNLFPLAIKALNHGKDILIEKPVAITIKDARELYQRALNTDRIVMTGYTFYFNPAVRAMKEFVQTGSFGTIFYLYSIRAHLGLIREDVSVVWDLAPHDISIFTYILDQYPIGVSAVGGCYLDRKFEDVAFINLFYPNNVVGNIHVSWISSNKIREVVVVGSKKRIVFDDLNNFEKIRIFERGVSVERPIDSFGEFQFLLRDGNIISPSIEMKEPLKLECQHFVECIKTRKKPLTDILLGRKIVEILDAIDKSLRRKGKYTEVEYMNE